MSYDVQDEEGRILCSNAGSLLIAYNFRIPPAIMVFLHHSHVSNISCIKDKCVNSLLSHADDENYTKILFAKYKYRTNQLKRLIERNALNYYGPRPIEINWVVLMGNEMFDRTSRLIERDTVNYYRPRQREINWIFLTGIERDMMNYYETRPNEINHKVLSKYPFVNKILTTSSPVMIDWNALMDKK